jgi:hypothetical protein
MSETENAEVRIERIDRYTIKVNGHRVTANKGQECALRAMDADAVRRFLAVMGYSIPPEAAR